ncbi:MAG TPA: TetR/AcrR family transcriptional regulator, partial [Candidatus Limnocylindrales bacterium]|nr:TetR/AcrR family transcriptional regulator [Candidatus Limnocylindrales bacterium]
IEAAASGLFRERGYAATSVRDIARALDIQGPSLYAHVASKEDLLWSIVLRAADRFTDAVAPLALGNGPPAERLAAMIRAHVRVITAEQPNASTFLHEWRFLGQQRRAEVAARRDAYEALFRRVIADGVTAGELETPDPKLAATAILSALNGIAGWYRSDGPLSPEQLAEQLADLFLRALRPTDRRRTDR